MQIKAGYLQHIDIIHNLAKRIWEPTYKNILSQEQLGYMFEMMYSPSALNEQIAGKNHRFILISNEEDSYIGFASFEVDYLPETTKIHKLYLLPESQGKGAGGALVEHVGEIAKSYGNTRIILNVNRFNPAYYFYLKSGFIKEREENIDIGYGYLMEDFIMVKYI